VSDRILLGHQVAEGVERAKDRIELSSKLHASHITDDQLRPVSASLQTSAEIIDHRLAEVEARDLVTAARHRGDQTAAAAARFQQPTNFPVGETIESLLKKLDFRRGLVAKDHVEILWVIVPSRHACSCRIEVACKAKNVA
jgi:hypothetical protein